eukprot:1363405-Amorphochlora_amoeboformis.AAC.1
MEKSVGSAERRMATLTGGTRTKYDVPLARQGSTLSTQQANSIKRSMLNVFEVTQCTRYL